jgi:hypothetical protein
MRTIEQETETRDRRRCKADDRWIARMDKRLNEAAHLVGEIIREGVTVFYINVRSKAGGLTGKTREFANYGTAVGFLVRNRYV